MILVDTSVWVDHLRRADTELIQALGSGSVLCHPFVLGEVACGSLRNRAEVLGALAQIPRPVSATHDEAVGFMERHALHGRGIGWIDIHLLASTALTAGARLWTRDKRLSQAAVALSLQHRSTAH